MLKNNKAAGNDSIINEYIKSTAHIMLPIYTNLFNLIFDTGIIPEIVRVYLFTRLLRVISIHTRSKKCCRVTFSFKTVLQCNIFIQNVLNYLMTGSQSRRVDGLPGMGLASQKIDGSPG